LRIADVGLAPWNILDVLGIDHQRLETGRFQRRVRTLPINARAFHDHQLGLQLRRPFGQCPAIALEGAELPLFDPVLATLVFNDGTGRNLRLVHVQANDALVKCRQLHHASF
jgi:hypothetical protein